MKNSNKGISMPLHKRFKKADALMPLCYLLLAVGVTTLSGCGSDPSSDTVLESNPDTTPETTPEPQPETTPVDATIGYQNEAWFALSAQACVGDDEHLQINNGQQLVDLSSKQFSCTRTDSDEQLRYNIVWTGSDLDHDGQNDSISFDLIVEGFTGSTYSYSETADASSMTALGTASAVTDVADITDLDAVAMSVWGVDSSDEIDGVAAGQTLRFSIENIDVSVSGYTGQFNGFTFADLVETNGGRDHSYIIGEGESLASGIFSTPTSSINITPNSNQLVITGAGDYYSERVWGITKLQFSLSITDPTLETVWDATDYSRYGVGATYSDIYPAEEVARQALFPKFSWDSVPRWLAVRNANAYSDEQISLIANNYQLVMLEKANQAGLETVDAGIKETAARLKAVNPDIKTIFYWNTQVHYTGYSSDAEYEENASEWSTLNDNGSIYLFKDIYYWHDESVKGMRDWWVNFPVEVASDANIDGVFLDKMPEAAVDTLFVDGEPVSDYINMINTLWESMPQDKLLMGNALRGERDNGSRAVMEILDGSYLERWDYAYDFELPAQTTADAISLSMQLMREALAQGKFINFQTGSYSGEEGLDSYEDKLAYMQDNIDFPLAIFLIIAEENAFFSYQGSVNAIESAQEVWDCSDLEELTRPLGAPLGDPTKDGYIYTRSYQYVDVWVDVESKEAKLTWRDAE